jgi:hypothetical protein
VLVTLGEIASVRAENYPNVDELTITLDGAKLRPNAPLPPKPVAPTELALRVDDLTISGRNVSFGTASANLLLRARDVQFDRGADSDGNIVLLIKSAAEGTIEVSASKRDIENLIAQVAKTQAERQGVTIENVTLTTKSRDSRSIDAEVQLRAKKLFFTAVVRISASLAIDELMTAKLSGVSCSGDGAIGTLACSVLDPHLQKLNGRAVPLMALPLGNVQLRDVRLVSGDELKVSAEFGSRA